MKWGGPSARAAIYAIANHANDDWFCWAKQETLARESEQSPDSIQRRIQEFVDIGRVRRIKLKRFGRRTHDFLILKPSPYFAASIEEIEPFLPRGCDIMLDQDATATCGSVESQDDAAAQQDSEINATATCGSDFEATLPQPAVDATALVRQPNEPLLEPSTLTQTLSQPAEGQGLSKEEAAATSTLETWLKKFRETYPLPDSRPEFTRAECEKFTADQREQCLHGATGVVEYLRKNPKARGIVGPLRFVRSSALWAEWSRFAPAARTAPAPRIWVELDTEEWRARTVLHAMINREMPIARPNWEREGKRGADFLGHLPPAGLSLARFTDEFGNVDVKTWALLYAGRSGDQSKWSDAERRDFPHVRAWAERVNECCGVQLAPDLIILDEMYETTLNGKPFKARKRMFGLRVPASWPPPKGTGQQKTEHAA